MYIGRYGSNYTSYAVKVGYTANHGRRQYCGIINDKGTVDCGAPANDNVQARKNFCQRFGPVQCSNGVNVCRGERCPQGIVGGQLIGGVKSTGKAVTSSGGMAGTAPISAKGNISLINKGGITGSSGGAGSGSGRNITQRAGGPRTTSSGLKAGSGASARGDIGVLKSAQGALAPVIEGYENIGDSLEAAGLPSWALPAGIVGLGLVLAFVIFKK